MAMLCVFAVTHVGPRDMQVERGLACTVLMAGRRDLGHSFNLLPRGWGARLHGGTFGLVVILVRHLQNSPLNPSVRLNVPSPILNYPSFML